MSELAPSGFVVQILSTSLAAAMAGKLLADGGAQVLRVEPVGGSDLSRRPPLTAGGTSAWFRHLCRNTTVVTEGDVVPVWAGAPDVVLVDDDRPAPSDLPASTVVVGLSAYGTGPYAAWRPSELTTWALGGYLSFTGDPEREPLWLSGGQAALHAGCQAAFAALAALYRRDLGPVPSGKGQRVEVDELSSVLAAHVWLVSSWASCGQVLPRVPCDLIRALDGWCYVMRIVPNDELFVLIDRPDLAAENLTADLVLWFDNIDRIFAAVAEWAHDHTVADIVELGQQLRVAVTPVRTAADLATDSWPLEVGGTMTKHPVCGCPGRPSVRRGQRFTSTRIRHRRGSVPLDRRRQAPRTRSRVCVSSRSPTIGPVRLPGECSPTSAPTWSSISRALTARRRSSGSLPTPTSSSRT